MGAPLTSAHAGRSHTDTWWGTITLTTPSRRSQARERNQPRFSLLSGGMALCPWTVPLRTRHFWFLEEALRHTPVLCEDAPARLKLQVMNRTHVVSPLPSAWAAGSQVAAPGARCLADVAPSWPCFPAASHPSTDSGSPATKWGNHSRGFRTILAKSKVRW